MFHEHKATFAAVSEDGRTFIILESQEFRHEIAFGRTSERAYGASTYRTEDGEDVNANEDGTFTIVSSGTVLRRKD